HRPYLGDRCRARRAWSRVEDGQLAEHVRRPHDRQQILAAVGRATADFDLARDDDVQAGPRFAFGEDGVPAPEIDRLQLFGQRSYSVRLDTLEDSGPGQDLVHVAPLKLSRETDH